MSEGHPEPSQARPTGRPRSRVGEVLARVPFLFDLDQNALAAVEEAGQLRRLRDGEQLVVELEPGDDLYVLIEGRIEITIGAGNQAWQSVALLEPGASIGEVALFTGELRSATATARGPATVLGYHRDVFFWLCQSYPRIAVGLSRVLAVRHVETDRVIAGLLEAPAPSGQSSAARPRAGRALAAVGESSGMSPSKSAPIPAIVEPRKGFFRRAWRELVQNHRRELPFLILASFLGALVVARLGVGLALLSGGKILPVLRACYLGGLGLTAVAGLVALLNFRPGWRRAVCIAYGAGLALAFNELSVFIAFDVFFVDMTTRDPRLEFNAALLYRRSESFYALTAFLLVAIQATYLRRFYRRLLFDAGVRLRALLRRLTG